ncbi:hypothetical protein AURDEDRAFT_68944 [Auricularia subglabra TFB-10046 SS5]|nr:hypothetical protein AURDEDRAFT_68944 [Auricularia subglabra TFB-10046 SS5]
MDNATLFSSYEQDFQQIIQSAQAKLDGEAKEQRGEQRKATLRRVDMELDEADEMVSQMEVEIHGMPASIKSQFQARARQAKADLARLKKTARELSQRSELLGSRSPAADDPYNTDARTRLLAGTETLADGTRRLEESQRLALETDTDILRNARSMYIAFPVQDAAPPPACGYFAAPVPRPARGNRAPYRC